MFKLSILFMILALAGPGSEISNQFLKELNKVMDFIYSL